MTGATQPSVLQRHLVSAWTRRGPLAYLLWPISLIYGALAALRQALYLSGILKMQHVPVPVIVVGNVVAGGAGKTPIVMALVRHLQARGLHPGVISRGYGRRARDCREVLTDSAIADVGDEPALIKNATAAPVFVAARRFDAAQSLLARYPDTQVIVCDDGLQHWALQRDIEICVFDDRGTGNGFLLPAGPLREPWPRKVDLVLHTGLHPAFAGFAARRTLARHALRADGSEMALDDLLAANAKPLLAVAAIAQPDEFFRMLRAQGLNLAQTLALPDHYDFDSWMQSKYEGYTVICTEKDAFKLWPKQADALAVPLDIALEPAFTAQLDTLLAKPLASTLSSPHGHTTS
ncbi:tetraacyldisaccharide 4'-kinase [Rhodoferax sp.]|uniref:tetraacyldisaccharide 4'-kinase n=1 Tax=Rhodoferax sp. TaxID=50421 RepID=UPI001EC3FE2B|nr:tetraacyldisaccharide 4'-kinase [Rhodoferax sp.]MBT9508449.1 tetraacyldisaccharide 4'-kinase [Rhodoferax sp.]